MISPQRIHRYPFFAGLNHDYGDTLARVADEVSVEAGHWFFREGDELPEFYLALEGAIAIIIEVPDRDAKQPLSAQLTGKLTTREITVSSVGKGDVFAWSALVPPYRSTAGAKAITRCRVVAFNREKLRPIFEEDCCFAHLMTQKAAQVIRKRLRDMRIESLVTLAG